MDLIEKKFTAYKNLSFEEICNRVSLNPLIVLLDVRSSSEFKGTARNSFGIFNKAINIDVRELADRINELEKYKTSEIIVYCSHSIRSPRASSLLIQQGFTNVSNMTGGVSTLTVENSQCATRLFIPFK
ncbi:MAG: rhodanese-like domain-containing protein [Flammeovirgaceae bacterium]|nr:rhodanese-like domain-containing protein [Flammeovirgaceae bacterium]